MKSDKLTILQCAGGSLAIRDDLKYAGTERIIFWLNRAFNEMGHETLVAASADSDLRGYGTLLPTVERSLWQRTGTERTIIDNEKYEEAHNKKYKKSLEFVANNDVDIMHDHSGSSMITSKAYLEVRDKIDTPLVSTLHGPVKEGHTEKYQLWRKMKEEGRPIFANAISESQRRIFEERANIGIDRVILHGLPIEKSDFQPHKKDFLFWIGRIYHGKGTDLAIQVAKATGRPLIIAGEVHTPNKAFYNTSIQPHITRAIENGSQEEQEAEREKVIEALEEGREIARPEEVLFIGPLDDRQKSVFFRHAYAMLMPNRWEEPFGLTLIESMAAGTPVIGTATGALPEIIVNDKTGYLVTPQWKRNGKKTLVAKAAVEDMSYALDKLSSIPNLARNCRTHVEKNFTLERMARDYIEFYNEILAA